MTENQIFEIASYVKQIGDLKVERDAAWQSQASALNSRAMILHLARELADKCVRGERACAACGACSHMGTVTHNRGCAVLRLKEFQ